MQDKMVAIKASITAVIAAASAFLGWRGVLAVVWVAAMALDYISGTAAACKSGNWSSQTARAGIWHKCGMIAVVLVTALADGCMSLAFEQLPLEFDWPSLLLPLVLVWYVLTELGSVLENAVEMGANVPSWLSRILEVTLSTVDKMGDKAAEDKDADA